MKRLLTVSLALFIMGNLSAQFKGNEFGVSYHYGTSKLERQNQTLKLVSGFYGFTWYPKFIITEFEKSSLSVGAPFTIGLSAYYNSQGQGDIRIGLDAPLVVDYNIGFGAKAEDASEKGIGGFLGAGFGYSRSRTSDYEFGGTGSGQWDDIEIMNYEYSKSYGPLFHGGLRFPLGQDGMGITVRFAYKKGLEEEKFNYYSGSILFRFK